MAGVLNRIIGASILKSETYEEVEADKGATGQAVAVVVLGALSAGIGWSFNEGLIGLFRWTLVQLGAWFIWALAAYLIGAKLLPEPQTSSNLGELLRTIGFASAPSILYAVALAPLLLVPFIGFLALLLVLPLALALWIWHLFAWVIAVRQALDYTSTLRAVGVCLLSFFFYLVAVVIYLILFATFNFEVSGTLVE